MSTDDISSTFSNLDSPLFALQATTSVGSAWNKYRAALMQYTPMS